MALDRTSKLQYHLIDSRSSVRQKNMLLTDRWQTHDVQYLAWDSYRSRPLCHGNDAFQGTNLLPDVDATSAPGISSQTAMYFSALTLTTVLLLHHSASFKISSLGAGGGGDGECCLKQATDGVKPETIFDIFASSSRSYFQCRLRVKLMRSRSTITKVLKKQVYNCRCVDSLNIRGVQVYSYYNVC